MISALRTHLRRLSGDTESGQALVEFALVFPAQLLLTLGIVQFAYLAHAHLVVAQAAFQGARAGAVADMNPNLNTGAPATRVKRAGKRAVARTVALLTSGGGDVDGSLPSDFDGALEWKNATGDYGYSAERQIEAYALLAADAASDVRTEQTDDYVMCEVHFDYIMEIPVGNHLFAPWNLGPVRRDKAGNRLTTFRVHRVALVATPWKKPPLPEEP